jgi:SWI/SNF-related matrix-associated actin-dependent regulator of chromatin subfamily A member 5
LIVAPNTTLGNWFKELRKWLPSFRVVKLYARKEYREETFSKYLIKGNFDICITSYEGLNICTTQLKKFDWKYIIIDEAHRLKNEQSLLSKNLRLFKTDLRLLITGTPLQNNLHELWSLLNYLLPDLFDSSEIFDSWFAINSSKESENLTPEEIEKKNVEIINSLHRILKPFILRRTKADLEHALPPKKEVHVYVGLSELQCAMYKNILLKKQATDDKKFYMNVLMQLRKCCNHPYLFEGAEAEGAPALGEHLVSNCGKLVVLSKLLKKLHGKSQVLIFSQMTSVLNILEDYCNYREYKYCRIDGDTWIEDRERAIEDFTDPNSDKFIFLLSTRAGGLGINLATADTVVLYDSDWNPQVDLQAMDRAHRIGQKNPVMVYRLITENSIEEKIIERQKIKLKWDSLVVQKGKLAEKGKGMNKDELKDLINYGACEIFKAQGGTITDDDIDALLVRGELRQKDKEDEIAKKVEERATILDLGITSINIYEFEGSNYLDKKKEDEAAMNQAYYQNLERTLGTRRAIKLDAFNQELKKVKIFVLNGIAEIDPSAGLSFLR